MLTDPTKACLSGIYIIALAVSLRSHFLTCLSLARILWFIGPCNIDGIKLHLTNARLNEGVFEPLFSAFLYMCPETLTEMSEFTMVNLPWFL